MISIARFVGSRRVRLGMAIALLAGLLAGPGFAQGRRGKDAAGGSPPAPPSGVDVEAEKARVEEMQALSEQHVRELAQGSEEFTARMQAAKTREERSAIQQEFQRFQTEKNAAFQQRMTELRGRR